MRWPTSASVISICPRRHIASGKPFTPHAHNEKSTMYAFELVRPKSLADASSALAQSGGKALADGQSLVAAMKLRLAQPNTLVDLWQLPKLRGISRQRKTIKIGAFTTHAEVAESD